MRAPIGMASPASPQRIAAAVPVLVVRAHDRHDGVGEVDRRQDVGADVDVQLHLLELGRRQLARLVEDVLRHRQFSGVVQQRGGVDGLEGVGVVDAEGAGETDGEALDAADVIVGDAVLGLDGGGQGFDGRQVEPVHPLDVQLRIAQPTKNRTERHVEDDDQRDHGGGGEQARRPHDDDQTEGRRGRCDIVHRERQQPPPHRGQRSP